MIVYIALGIKVSLHYPSSVSTTTLGVFSTREKAEEFANNWKEEKRSSKLAGTHEFGSQIISDTLDKTFEAFNKKE